MEKEEFAVEKKTILQVSLYVLMIYGADDDVIYSDNNKQMHVYCHCRTGKKSFHLSTKSFDLLFSDCDAYKLILFLS